MTPMEVADQHVERANALLAEAEKTWKGPVGAAKGACATAHATLALFWQREAEKQNA